MKLSKYAIRDVWENSVSAQYMSGPTACLPLPEGCLTSAQALEMLRRLAVNTQEVLREKKESKLASLFVIAYARRYEQLLEVEKAVATVQDQYAYWEACRETRSRWNRDVLRRDAERLYQSVFVLGVRTLPLKASSNAEVRAWIGEAYDAFFAAQAAQPFAGLWHTEFEY